MTWQNFTDSELSTYLQELAAESSPTCYLGIDPSAPSNSKTTLAVFSHDGRLMGICHDSQSGTTSEPSTELPGEESLTLSAADSPARTSPQRVKVEDLPESVQDFGSRCSGLLEKFGLALSSPKTVRTCVPVDLAPSSKDLPRWGMTFAGACWELGTSVQITNETECGYWPTPRTTGLDGGSNSRKAAKARGMWPTPTAQGGRSQGQLKMMREKVDAGELTVEEAESMVGGSLCPPSAKVMWPTPKCSDERASRGCVVINGKFYRPSKHIEAGKLCGQANLADAVLMYPTASARDWKDTPGMTAQRKDGKSRNDQLARRIYSEEQTPSGGGSLNPTWVEWLMGWPIGWTESKPLGTDKFHSWRQLHGTSSPAVSIHLDIDPDELRKIVVQVLNFM